MSKKLYLLMIALLAAPLILTACGSKKSNKNTVKLTQTFTSITGLTMQFPDGWAARDSAPGVEIANSPATLDKMDNNTIEQAMSQDVVAILLSAPESPDAIGMSGKSAKEIMTAMTSSLSSNNNSGMKLGNVQDVKVGPWAAARVNVSEEKTKSEGFFIGFMLDSDHILMITVVADQGNLSKYESAALAVIGSITYQVPPAPTQSPAVTNTPAATNQPEPTLVPASGENTPVVAPVAASATPFVAVTTIVITPPGVTPLGVTPLGITPVAVSPVAITPLAVTPLPVITVAPIPTLPPTWTPQPTATLWVPQSTPTP